MADKLVRLNEVRDIPSNGTQPQPHSWQPASLIDRAANPPDPPTIGGLLYPGTRTVLSGETESMKTWLALILCKAELDIGLTVGWADLDAMGPGAMLERLDLIGTDRQAVHERFLYYEPAEMLDPAKKTEIADTIRERRIRLFVVDAFNPILVLHGLDPHSTPDIEKFWIGIADTFCRAGAACVLLDHVAKNAETRGKYSYGSERKASGAIVHIGFRLLEPLSRGGKGRSLLTVHKDRPGHLPRPTIGRLLLESDHDRIFYKIEPDKSHPDDGEFRPTVKMEQISKKLEAELEGKSKNWIEKNVGGSKPAIATALPILTREGFLTETHGPRNSSLYTSLRPYREAEDHPIPTDDNDLPATSPDFPTQLRSTHPTTSPPIPPYTGGMGRSGSTTGQDLPPADGEVIHEYDVAPIDETLQPYELDDQ